MREVQENVRTPLGGFYLVRLHYQQEQVVEGGEWISGDTVRDHGGADLCQQLRIVDAVEGDTCTAPISTAILHLLRAATARC